MGTRRGAEPGALSLEGRSACVLGATWPPPRGREPWPWAASRGRRGTGDAACSHGQCTQWAAHGVATRVTVSVTSAAVGWIVAEALRPGWVFYS